MAEALTKTRSELKVLAGALENTVTIAEIVSNTGLTTVGGVSVCVSVAIGDSLSLLQEFYHVVLTAQYRPAGEHTLRGSHQYLGHYGRCAGYS